MIGPGYWLHVKMIEIGKYRYWGLVAGGLDSFAVGRGSAAYLVSSVIIITAQLFSTKKV